MKKNHSLLLLTSAMLLFSSCSHYYYAPNSSNTPLFREKNELSASGQLLTGGNHQGVEVQAAYAVGKHTAVMANFAEASNAKSSNDLAESEAGRGSFAEVGLGLFYPLPNSRFVFETFGGGGVGSIKNDYGMATSTTRFNRFFLQPDIGFRSKYFDFIVSGRFSLVNLKIKGIHNAEYLSQTDIDQLVYVGEHRTSLLWEPGVAVRAGGKSLKGKFQITRSYNLNNQDLIQDDLAISVGISFMINTKKRL
jgi:hypothetical protein